MTQQKSNKAALYILMFNMFIAMGSIGIIIPVMPEYLKIFGAAGQVLGMLIATFALAQFVFSPIAGNLSDQYGRKKSHYFWPHRNWSCTNFIWAFNGCLDALPRTFFLEV